MSTVSVLLSFFLAVNISLLKHVNDCILSL